MMRSMFLVMCFLVVNATARFVSFDPTGAGFGKSDQRGFILTNNLPARRSDSLWGNMEGNFDNKAVTPNKKLNVFDLM